MLKPGCNVIAKMMPAGQLEGLTIKSNPQVGVKSSTSFIIHLCIDFVENIFKYLS